MKDYILIGHKISIEEVWSDVTSREFDPTINKLPTSVRLERIGSIHDLHQAVEDYFQALDEENGSVEENEEDIVEEMEAYEGNESVRNQ